MLNLLKSYIDTINSNNSKFNYNIGFEVSNINENSSSISFDIYYGDWKHDHLAFNDLIMKSFGDDVLRISESVIEEDGSDCYSSTHTVYFKPKEINEIYISEFWDKVIDKILKDIIDDGYSFKSIENKIVSYFSKSTNPLDKPIVKSNSNIVVEKSRHIENKSTPKHINYPTDYKNRDLSRKIPGAKVYIKDIGEASIATITYAPGFVTCGKCSDDGYVLESSGEKLNLSGYLSRFGLSTTDAHRVFFVDNIDLSLKTAKKNDYYTRINSIEDLKTIHVRRKKSNKK